jgi:hypothetical protein
MYIPWIHKLVRIKTGYRCRLSPKNTKHIGRYNRTYRQMNIPKNYQDFGAGVPHSL